MRRTTAGTMPCATCHRRRSRTRLYFGECTSCTGLVALLLRDALGRFTRLRVTITAKPRRRSRPVAVATVTQLALF